MWICWRIDWLLDFLDSWKIETSNLNAILAEYIKSESTDAVLLKFSVWFHFQHKGARKPRKICSLNPSKHTVAWRSKQKIPGCQIPIFYSVSWWWWLLLLLQNVVEYPLLMVDALKSFRIWDIDIFFAFLFREKKYVKKQLVQDRIPPPSMYIHMCILYTYTNEYMPKFSPSGFFGPSRCLVPTPGLTSKYPMCSACVCVCIHTYTPTYTATRVKKYRTHRQNPYPSFCQKQSPTPSHNCSP